MHFERLTKQIALFLLLSSFPHLANAEIKFAKPSEPVSIDELVHRDGKYYEKFTDIPFNGQVVGRSQGNIVEGKRDGYWVEYYPNGQLHKKGEYILSRKEGEWIGYYDNGQIFYKESYVNGGLDGYSILYFKNGVIAQEGNWEYGTMTGHWVFNLDDGSRIDSLTGTYENSLKVSD